MTDTSRQTEDHGRVADPITTLRSLFAVVLRRIWIIALMCVLFCGAALALSALQAPRYEASVTMLVGQGKGITQSPNEALGLQQLTQTVATMADSPRVYESVIKRFHLGISPQQFEQRFSAQQVSATQLVQINYTDTDPQTARQVANALGEQFSTQINNSGQNSGQITATIWNRADTPTDPVSPKPLRNAVLAFLFGGMLGVGLAFLLEFFDDSWSSPEEAEQISGVPTFGVIPEFAAGASPKKIARGERKQRKRVSGSEGYVPDEKDGEGGKGPKAASSDHNGSRAPNLEMNLPVGVLFLEKDGRVSKSNEAFKEITGLSEGEIVGKDVFGLASHPDDVEESARLHTALAAGELEHYQVEKRLIKKNGELTWVRLTVSRLPEDEREGGEHLVGVVEEISDYKQIEEKLKLSTESERLATRRLQVVLQNSAVGVHSITPDGYLLAGRTTWEDLWQPDDPESAGGGNVFENGRAQKTGLAACVKDSIASKTHVTTRPMKLTRPPQKGGGEFWVRAEIHPMLDEAGRVQEVVLLVEDVTSGRRVEEELEEARGEHGELREALRNATARRERVEQELEKTRARFQSLVELVTGEKEGRENGKH